jgi:hypothetical protein
MKLYLSSCLAVCIILSVFVHVPLNYYGHVISHAPEAFRRRVGRRQSRAWGVLFRLRGPGAAGDVWRGSVGVLVMVDIWLV